MGFQISMIEQNYICKHFMNSCNIHASSLVHMMNWIGKKKHFPFNFLVNKRKLEEITFS